jgi:hypothetical protein
MTTPLEHRIASPKECIFLLIKNDDCNDLNKQGQKSPKFDFQSKFPCSKIFSIISFYLISAHNFRY